MHLSAATQPESCSESSHSKAIKCEPSHSMEPVSVRAPGVDETLCVGNEQPRPDGDADEGCNHSASGKADALRRQVYEGIRHGHHVGCDVCAEGRQYETCQPNICAVTFA